MILPSRLKMIFKTISALVAGIFLFRGEVIRMRCLTKMAVVVVCLVLLPLCGVSFGQDVNAKGMVVKGEMIKPVPGVSVEVAVSQQKAKEDLVAQKQALETDPHIPRPIPLPGEDKLPIELLPVKDGEVCAGDSKKIDIPGSEIIEKPSLSSGDGLKIEPVGPIIIKIPQPGPGFKFRPPRFVPLPPVGPIIIKMPQPGHVLKFWPFVINRRPPQHVPPMFLPPRWVPPRRVGGLLGSVINITVELTKKEIL